MGEVKVWRWIRGEVMFQKSQKPSREGSRCSSYPRVGRRGTFRRGNAPRSEGVTNDVTCSGNNGVHLSTARSALFFLSTSRLGASRSCGWHLEPNRTDEMR